MWKSIGSQSPLLTVMVSPEFYDIVDKEKRRVSLLNVNDWYLLCMILMQKVYSYINNNATY